jgi:hypothetical protein
VKSEIKEKDKKMKMRRREKRLIRKSAVNWRNSKRIKEEKF